MLQRKPSRERDILKEARLVIKSTPAKVVPTTNVKKTKLTSEIVRKAVIDALAHTDSMEEALHRALQSFGDRNTFWDQVTPSLSFSDLNAETISLSVS